MIGARERTAMQDQDKGCNSIVFLVRHFNDIDHMVPIIYRMLKDGEARLLVFCMNPGLPIRDDFRLRFLNEKFGCETKYIYQAYKPTLKHHIFALVHCQIPHWNPPIGLRWASSIVTRLARRAVRHLQTDKLYDIEWARAFLLGSNVATLVIDWGELNRFIYGPISSAADELGVTKVGVPHGVKFYADEKWTNRHVIEEPENWAVKYSWMTHLVVESENSRKRHSFPGYSFPAERMHVLGSARFCEEWQEVYQALIPKSVSRNWSSQLKVLFFDHASFLRMNPEEIAESLAAVADLEFVDLTVKPHTRATEPSFPILTPSINVDSQTHSLDLIRWSDVVISTISSIVLDAFHQKKVFIYPQRFSDSRMIFETYGACWSVSSKEELVNAMHSLRERPSDIPYSQSNVEVLERDIVYCGVDDTDVLGNYADLLLSQASSYETPSLKRGLD